MINKPLCDIEKRLQKIVTRAQNFIFIPNHKAGVNNKIADALSKQCGVISKTEISPDDNIRLLQMSEKTEEYRKLKKSSK